MGLTLAGERVVLRPVREEDAARLRALRATPEVSAWWHPAPPGWPLDADEGTCSYVVEVAGDVAGFIQSWEETEPDFRHAGIDLFLGPAWIGRGLGADAVRTLARHLLCERGHHRLTIDPDAGNAAAIRSYERVGFRIVGTMRAFGRSTDRSEWRDHVLMDLLAGELR